MNVHFWDYIHCPVKITLKPNQELKYSQFYYNSEGYTSKLHGWEYKDNKVYYKLAVDAIDCDGRMTTYDEYECDINELHSYHNSESNLNLPNWKEVTHSQRDFFAEAAGY